MIAKIKVNFIRHTTIFFHLICLEIYGVADQDIVSLFTDSSCSTKVGETTAGSTSVDITVTAPMMNNTYNFYAQRSDASFTSVCSTAHVEYILNDILHVPTNLSLNTPATSPGIITTPTIDLNGVESGEIVQLFTDPSCSTKVGEATAWANSIFITATLPADDTYNFYANTTNGAEHSACSSDTVQYVLDAITTVSFATAFNTTTEGTNGSSITVMSSYPKSYPITVYYDVIGSTAVNGVNHNLSTGSFVIPANQTSVQLTLNATDNGLTEGEKFLQVNINAASSGKAIIGTRNQTRQYILDNESSYVTTTDVCVGEVTCAITSDEVLKCWGFSSNGLGDGATTLSLTPVVVDPGEHYAKVSTSNNSSPFTCAITTTGVLKCWGLNSNGQVGNGTTTTQGTPLVIDSGTPYTSVSVNSNSACGIASGTNVLKCWGYNNAGQLGNGDTTNQLSPIVIDTGVQYSQITTPCGITITGELKCANTADNKILGNGALQFWLRPTGVEGP